MSASPPVETAEPAWGGISSGLGDRAAPGGASRLTRADVLRLQRTAGNAAVAMLLRERSAPATEEAPAPGPDPAAGGLDPSGAEAAEATATLPPPRVEPEDSGKAPSEPAQEDEGAHDDPGGAPIEGEPPQTGEPDDMREADEAGTPDSAVAARVLPRAVVADPHAGEESSGAALGGPEAGPPAGGTRAGIVAESGKERAKLRKGPSTGSKVVAELPFNTRVFIARRQDGWYFVTLGDGRYGYISDLLVKTNLPEPTARLDRIGGGESAIALAQRLYGHLVKPGQDLRFYVNVLEYVNRGPGLRGVYQPDPSDHSRDAWKQVRTRSDYMIWVPSGQFAQSLKNVVSSGSLTGGLWAQTRHAIQAVESFAIGGAAFVAGLLDGAVASVWDLLVGLKDVIGALWGVLRSLFEGNILRDASHLWGVVTGLDPKEIAESWVKNFVRQWNDPDVWTRWKFRGWVVGYAIAEIALIVLTGGGTLALKLVARLGKLGDKLMGAIKGLRAGLHNAKPPAAAVNTARNRLITAENRAIPHRVPEGPDHYAPLRGITDGHDIDEIAKATGLPRKEVEAAKRHLMDDEHLLVGDDGDLYRGRFTPEEETAARWKRAARGDGNEHDRDFLTLLVRHEFEEGKMMSGGSLRSLEQAFFRGELEGMLRTFLSTKLDWDQARIARMLEQEPKPMTPYRYAHLVTSLTKAPNPS